MEMKNVDVTDTIIISDEPLRHLNDETIRMKKLIGKQLTRIEIRNGNIYLEFDPFGSISMSPRMAVELVASINAEVI